MTNVTEQNYDLGKRVFKLITNEIIIGSSEYVEVKDRGIEILIKKPFTAKGGNILPYMADILMNAPAAIQIHPMNVIWSVALDEFKEANDAYTKATSVIDLSAARF